MQCLFSGQSSQCRNVIMQVTDRQSAPIGGAAVSVRGSSKRPPKAASSYFPHLCKLEAESRTCYLIMVNVVYRQQPAKPEILHQIMHQKAQSHSTLVLGLLEARMSVRGYSWHGCQMDLKSAPKSTSRSSSDLS